jgi:hypothetical protein
MLFLVCMYVLSPRNASARAFFIISFFIFFFPVRMYRVDVDVGVAFLSSPVRRLARRRVRVEMSHFMYQYKTHCFLSTCRGTEGEGRYDR